jgi:glycosidase
MLAFMKTNSILHRLRFCLIGTGVLSLAACEPSDMPRETIDPYQPESYIKIQHPEWAKDAAIYELNTRQFTPEGTFKAAAKQLPRLKELGITIVWLMPIHEIGEMNRKGELGSPYSVRDYFSVNHEFGTLDDLKNFVARAHELGMYVIIDWVANHTAWDNPLRTEHPDWYERDWKGDYQPTPWWDWSDIINLDYSHPEVRRYMTEALKYWVEEADIDGYRCDVAGDVPIEFWNNVRRELDAIKPVFMLAEWEGRDLHAEAFDMTYAFSWYETIADIVVGKKELDKLVRYYARDFSRFPEGGMRMVFVSNHDKNSWEGTQFEIFGDALQAAIVLSVVGEGMPLIYNGQEAGNERRLAFFEKDPIEWREHAIGDLYSKLLALHKRNSALWNGAWGAPMIRVPNDAKSNVISFVRQNDDDKVFAAFNFSGTPQQVTFAETLYHGDYTDFFIGGSVTLGADAQLAIEPWGYKVFVR